MIRIDINCDMGEGMGNEERIMPFISSANIACGYHAGDIETIIRTIMLAMEHGVAIGAHPSYPDRENFGRVQMYPGQQELYELVSVQVEFMLELCMAAGTRLHHVKPHGALYNVSARDKQVAATIAAAVRDIDPKLVLFGLAGSYSITEARSAGMQTAVEAFADRSYRDDGSLVPRTEPNALITETDAAVKQALQLAKERSVVTASGTVLFLPADTICIHGDGEHAETFAKHIREVFEKENILVGSVA